MERKSTSSIIADLVERRGEFLAFLERRIGDRVVAEDLLQEAFGRLGKLAGLRDHESADAWFYRVLRNAAIDRARRTRTQLRGLEAFASEIETHEAAPTPNEPARNVCSCVGPLKDALKPEYRDALDRIEIDGVSVKDYADELGITPGNAAVRVFRARDALRKQVNRTCGQCAELGCVDCTCDVEATQSPASDEETLPSSCCLGKL